MLQPVMESILLAEQALLYTLEFDLEVAQPLSELMKGLAELGITTERIEGDAKAFVQSAVNVLNDRC